VANTSIYKSFHKLDLFTQFWVLLTTSTEKNGVETIFTNKYKKGK